MDASSESRSELERLVIRKAALVGVLSGTAYGIVARFVAEFNALGNAFAVMSVAFLFLVPLVLGALTVRGLPDPSWGYRIFTPWIPTFLVVIAAVAVGWEGSICVAMALPVLLVFSSVGGILGATHAAQRPGVRPLLVALPFIVGPFERRIDAPTVVVETSTDITIAAPPDVIWPLVTSVDSIRPSEQRPALFIRLGFPRPISAKIDRAGVGGIRVARFERGLEFTETVTAWEDRHRLSFTIEPNTAAIPATTLDPHVTIGGPFFDVLTGTYELYPLTAGSTRLRLRSQHRLSTRFNLYAGWWADHIMRSIQENILEVHKARAEAKVHLQGVR